MKLKKHIFGIFCLFLSTLGLNAQCDIDLGSDLEVCSADLPINLGDNLDITADPGYTLSWDNGLGSDPNPSVSPPSGFTTYTLTLTDGACVESASITVEVHSPVADAGPDVQLCWGSSLQLDGTGSYSDSPIFGYSWQATGGGIDSDQEDQPQPIISLTSTTAIQLTVFDANFCPAEDIVNVLVNNLPAVDAGSDFNICYTGTPVVENLSGTSAGAGQWTGTGITDPAGEFTANSGGNFTLYYSYTDFNNCTNTDSIVAIVDTPVPVDLGPDYSVCHNSGVIDLGGSGTWSGDNVTSDGMFTPSMLGPNNLHYEEGSAACIGSDDLIINVMALPSIDLGSDVSICNGTSVTINPTETLGDNPIVDYAWSGGSIIGSTDQLSAELNSMTDATYVLQVEDSEGCVSQDQIDLTVLALPMVNAGSDIDVCEYSTPEVISLTGFSPVPGPSETGVWSGSGIIDPNGIYEEAGIGDHSLTYTFTDSNGCMNSDDINVNVIVPGAVDAGLDFSVCHNSGIINLGGSGTWSGDNVTANGDFTPSMLGTNNLTYEEGMAGCFNSDDLVITVLALPEIDLGADVSICLNTSETINPTETIGDNPISTYTWSGGSINGASNQLSAELDPIIDTQYTLLIEDTEGCQAQDDIQVTVLSLPIVDAGLDLDVCQYSTAEIVNLTGFSPVPGAGENGVWSGPGIIDSNGTYEEAGIGSHSITYTFTDSNGCINSDDLNVNVIVPTVVDAGSDFDICLNAGVVNLEQPGTWSGTDVTSNGVFTPNTAGMFTLNYEIIVGSCLSQDDLQVEVHSLPTADAGSDESICNGETVSLNGSGSSDNLPIINYTWSLGENISHPDDQNTTADPTSTQSYVLTVTDVQGCQDQASLEITVHDLPVVDAGVDFSICHSSDPFNLTGFSPIPGVGETGLWTGTGITDSSGEFTSPGNGSYNLTYTFTDNNSCTNSDMVEVTVVSSINLDAGSNQETCNGDYEYTMIGFSPATGGNWIGPGIVDAELGIVDISSIGVGVFNYTYEFGSGTCYTSGDMTLEVLANPIANAGPNEDFCLGMDEQALSGFSPVGGEWFGDGITDGSNALFDDNLGAQVYDIFYVYADPLTTCVDTVYKTVEVHTNPISEFNLDPIQCLNADIDAVNASSGSVDYDWDFDYNSDESTDFEPIYSYDAVGFYDIRLIAINGFSCADTTIQSIQVIDTPTADFDMSMDEGCIDIDVDFTNMSSGDFMTYTWDFDNTETSSLETPPTQNFVELTNSVTEYDVSLIATNNCGSNEVIKTVTVNPAPQAEFSTDQVQYCGLTVLVDNHSVGNPTDYLWEWGDSSSSNLADPLSHDYATVTDSTQFTISLTAENACGVDATTNSITIHPTLLVPDFSVDVDEGCVPLEINISDNSQGALAIEYDFGNTDMTMDQNPTYQYMNDGTFSITQTVSNTCGMETFSVDVLVNPLPVIDFDITNISLCEEQEIQFQNSSETINNIQWSFGDSNTSTNENPVHTYPLEGNYDVTLSGDAVSTGCSNSYTEQIVVNDTPESSFNIDNAVGCAPYSVTFNNTSVGATVYEWYYDDGNSDDVENPIHEFVNETDAPITFFVTLLAENNEQCSHISQTEITVNPSPLSDYSLSSYESCEFPVTINTINNSSNADDYLWTVTSNGTTSLFEPTYTFDAVGDYNFELYTENDYGCTSTSSSYFVVHPLPIISFTQDIASGCRNLEVSFENESLGADQFIWDFGDGSFSNQHSPTHIYVEPGNFDVRLQATSTVGCIDSLMLADHVEVFDLPTADFSFSPGTVDIYDPEVSFTDESIGASFYDWNFGDGSTSDEENPVYSYQAPGDYQIILSVMNEFGCIDAEIRNLQVTSDLTFYIPNSFSPNLDGINDVFKPVIIGADYKEFYQFSIYDRWGGVVFETNDIEKGWIGNNVKTGEYYVPDGEYVWVMELKLDENIEKVIEKGTVMIMR